MTREDALLYLPIESDDELDDVYDERLHEFQRFFISNVPVSRLFNAKIETLKKIHRAYEVLANEKIDAEFAPYEMLSYTTDNLYDLVVQFQNNQNNLRQGIVMSESVLELIDVAQQMLENMRSYAACWKVGFNETLPDIRVTHPIDEVGLLIELEELNKTNSLAMKDVVNLDSTSLVYKEAIRLSLWRKLEGNV